MNTIVCLEPWGGEAISKKDTGFGNRIIDWAILYYISTLREDCELLVQEEYWPELEFISLPRTKVTTISSDEVREKFLKLSLLNLVSDWYFYDNNEDDYINLMNQVDCWLSLQKKSQVDDEYSLGWNDCIENIKTKLM